jgi:excisionase family DNA binding protein
MIAADPVQRGYTPREVARQLRVSPERVRAWIARGELPAINTADPGERPRWVILPDHLAALLQRRQASPPPKLRRKRHTGFVDYFPGD